MRFIFFYLLYNFIPFLLWADFSSSSSDSKSYKAPEDTQDVSRYYGKDVSYRGKQDFHHLLETDLIRLLRGSPNLNYYYRYGESTVAILSGLNLSFFRQDDLTGRLPQFLLGLSFVMQKNFSGLSFGGAWSYGRLSWSDRYTKTTLYHDLQHLLFHFGFRLLFGESSFFMLGVESRFLLSAVPKFIFTGEQADARRLLFNSLEQLNWLKLSFGINLD